MLGQNTWSDFVDLADELEHWIVRKMLQSKFTLGYVSGIRLAEYSVSVTGYNLSTIEGRPQVVRDCLVAEIVTNTLLHLLEPIQHLLVGPGRQLVRN